MLVLFSHFGYNEINIHTNIHPKPSNVYFTFFKFIRAPTNKPVGPIFAFNTSYDVVLHKVVPFGGYKI